jgi:hypothetical protein
MLNQTLQKNNKVSGYYLQKKIERDEYLAFRYTNYRDTRPYVIKRCVVNELKAEQKWKYLKNFGRELLKIIKCDCKGEH